MHSPEYTLHGMSHGWYDFTIGSSRYIGLDWYHIVIHIPLFNHPPVLLLTIYKDKSFAIRLSYSFAGRKDSPTPTSIGAFDIELK